MRIDRILLLLVFTCAAGCASLPPQVEVLWEEKLRWIIQLEDLRILRALNTPPAVVLAPASQGRPAVLQTPPPSDLIRLLSDPEVRVRHRAALAMGRIGLSEAIEPLAMLLKDPEKEVRQMAAFAIGLIGDGNSRLALQEALNDSEPIVQGRAAEALGKIGNSKDAIAISAMVQVHIQDGRNYPLDSTVAGEAVQLGLHALAQLGSYEALTAAVLDTQGQPISHWWPVASSLQQISDPRAVSALLTLLQTEAAFTPAFAARGLGALKSLEAVEPLMRIVEQNRSNLVLVVQSIRALAAIGDEQAVPLIFAVAQNNNVPLAFRLEAVSAIGALEHEGSVEVLLNLLSARSPALRAAAMSSLAQVDPETFIVALSGLEEDIHWSVRAAQAKALGSLASERAMPRLTRMLQDTDQRVILAVLNSLIAIRAPRLESILYEKLNADDDNIRATAARGLGKLGITDSVNSLIRMYQDLQDEPRLAARVAALEALTLLDLNVAQPVLEAALMDKDWSVRVRAAELLRQVDSSKTFDSVIRPTPNRFVLDESEWEQIISPRYSPLAYIDTTQGTIEVELAVLDAPLTVANFMRLARNNFFEGMAIYRAEDSFVLQSGDPREDGHGDPGYTIRDEINQRPFLRGTLGMSLNFEDSAGSQFFITHSPQPGFDGRYSAFGQVVNGIEVVDKIEPWDIIEQVRIWDGNRMWP